MSICPLCQKRGKDWEGDDPKCAFNSGVFSKDNWNCATMSELRSLTYDNRTYSEDESCGVIPFDGKFIILKWYKNRGRTDEAILIDHENCVYQVGLEEAQECLKYYKERGWL